MHVCISNNQIILQSFNKHQLFFATCFPRSIPDLLPKGNYFQLLYLFLLALFSLFLSNMLRLLQTLFIESFTLYVLLL